MAKHNLSKAQLIAQYKDGADLINASNQAHLLLTVAILWDCFQFNADEIEEFMEDYSELLKSYDSGNEDVNELNAKIKELVGIDILKCGNK